MIVRPSSLSPSQVPTPLPQQKLIKDFSLLEDRTRHTWNQILWRKVTLLTYTGWPCFTLNVRYFKKGMHPPRRAEQWETLRKRSQGLTQDISSHLRDCQGPRDAGVLCQQPPGQWWGPEFMQKCDFIRQYSLPPWNNSRSRLWLQWGPVGRERCPCAVEPMLPFWGFSKTPLVAAAPVPTPHWALQKSDWSRGPESLLWTQAPYLPKKRDLVWQRRIRKKVIL